MSETLTTGADTTQAGVQAGADTPNPGDVQGQQPADKPVEKVEDKGGDKPAEYDLKMPEGMELDKAQADEFKGLARDMKLSPDAAQKLVDFQAKREQARIDAHAATVQGWVDAVKTDKDIGGDKLTEALTVAKKAIDLGPPELKTLLNESGFGSHPAVVKWAHAVGKALSEDRFVNGTRAVGAPKSIEDRLYGNTPTQ